ncbi:hypothetical protein C8R43DRAFT_1118468 [Mycena crocata]|nr:hypothetical protein C8R43DRAFT_1118468 [Mycena crocata]
MHSNEMAMELPRLPPPPPSSPPEGENAGPSQALAGEHVMSARDIDLEFSERNIISGKRRRTVSTRVRADIEEPLSKKISKPKSVNSYLSGICNQLDSFFPEIRARRNGPLVSRTLAGCMRRLGVAVKRKRPLGEDDILLVIADLGLSPAHDDMLFLSMLPAGHDGLLRLGELTIPDTVALRNARKLTLRQAVKATDANFSFFLPYHKADGFYEGNTIIIQRTTRLSR